MKLLIKYRWTGVITIIALLSFALNFYAISKIGYGNAYYAAAIRSMSQSFHNFFYVSFDPAGLVSIDKPPVALWIQTIFVLLFGYHGWVMLLPQALAGTGSVLLMYLITKRYLSRGAAALSALILALTPAVVVASRNNTMDMQLVFCLLCALFVFLKALDTGKGTWLYLTAALIGIGFNIKMLQAYMILPAILVTYFVIGKESIWKKIRRSVISLVLLLGISFSWVMAVDLTPASDRPYVGSSTDNTVMELIVGHNGLERLIGSLAGMGKERALGEVIGFAGVIGSLDPITGQSENPLPGVSLDPSGTKLPMVNGLLNTEGSGNGAVGNEIGEPGLFRLGIKSVYGQITWLIPLALAGIVLTVLQKPWRGKQGKDALLVFWSIWLLTMLVFFSFASFWHRYYLCMLAPAIAGICGPTLLWLYQKAKVSRRSASWFIGITGLTLAGQAIYVCFYEAQRGWLLPGMLGMEIIGLILWGLLKRKKVAFALLTGALLVAPAYWCLTVTLYPSQNSTMPYAGPELMNTEKLAGMTPNQENLTIGDPYLLALERYLLAHYTEGSYLVTGKRANDVAQFIVDTGLPTYAYGGFLGSDRSMTLEQLKELINKGKITYFMVSSQMTGIKRSDIENYVMQHGTLINPNAYNSGMLFLDKKTSSYNSNILLYRMKPDVVDN